MRHSEIQEATRNGTPEAVTLLTHSLMTVRSAGDLSCGASSSRLPMSVSFPADRGEKNIMRPHNGDNLEQVAVITSIRYVRAEGYFLFLVIDCTHGSAAKLALGVVQNYREQRAYVRILFLAIRM